MDPSGAQTILWVRRCTRCGSIDHHKWFSSESLAHLDGWICRICQSASYTLLRTRW